MEENLKKILEDTHDIKYGWIDSYGVKHTQAKRAFFEENYRYSSIESTIKSRVATCFEMAALMEYEVNKLNIPVSTYLINYNDDNKIAKHATCVAYLNNKYYLMENSWILEDPLHSFDTLNDLLLFVIWRFPKMYKIEPLDTNLIEVYKYTNPQFGITYKEFVNYVKSSEKIEVEYK